MLEKLQLWYLVRQDHLNNLGESTLSENYFFLPSDLQGYISLGFLNLSLYFIILFFWTMLQWMIFFVNIF